MRRRNSRCQLPSVLCASNQSIHQGGKPSEETDGDDLLCCATRIDVCSTESRSREWKRIFRHKPEFLVKQMIRPPAAAGLSRRLDRAEDPIRARTVQRPAVRARSATPNIKRALPAVLIQRHQPQAAAQSPNSPSGKRPAQDQPFDKCLRPSASVRLQGQPVLGSGIHCRFRKRELEAGIVVPGWELILVVWAQQMSRLTNHDIEG